MKNPQIKIKEFQEWNAVENRNCRNRRKRFALYSVWMGL